MFRRCAVASRAAAASVACAYLQRHAWNEARNDKFPKPFIIVSPTFYPSLDDCRCLLGLQSCRVATALGVQLLLVDASPEPVREALKLAGATVLPQTYKGRKGAALREVVSAAAAQLPPDGVICYQELEKVEMIPLQAEVAHYIIRSGSDFCVPRRADSLFQQSYPIEQYHSENFVNLYLDALANEIGFPSVDWTFGPVAFRASYAQEYLDFDGELWDAQIVPMIRAFVRLGARVSSCVVEYGHPIEMKADEEGGVRWSEKRLEQLNFLFRHVASELKKR
mmetsp:Transcript_21726/g.35862  ORF Transcript_21726/g.35862 Transcript_21726/m.35862 type:complete len:280 (+) Transcript_21726:71-910(+)|eukprot:CAMPEP_0119314776 /NCGR_PEP_ID=MMETSP1333-20130426/34020_1 /TAXON_ID=418940 /ORGANISM="Scyphosphaera apsteinii, Strain RCC1455" /LENGTH=279 /DNA_ID=CAMNT_0007319975 /DNA_START=71 /DNA_END=910 /DNA_ORIENTATION=+